MKVLWLVGSVLPQAALACGLKGGEIGGGWLTGQLNALRPVSELQLTVLCVNGRKSLTGTHDGVTYCVLPKDADLPAFLAAVKPDLVHIWGTEYPAATAMQRAAAMHRTPVLFSMQGLMRRYADHLCDGLPEKCGTRPGCGIGSTASFPVNWWTIRRNGFTAWPTPKPACWCGPNM